MCENLYFRRGICGGDLALILLLLIPFSNSQIIGSSVVTSVSVVLGNEDVSTLPSTAVTPPKVTTPPPPLKLTSPSKIVMVLPNNSTDPGVLSVIATLQNIVKEEHQKQSGVPPTTIPPGETKAGTAAEGTPSTAPLVVSDSPVDDDEAEAAEEEESVPTSTLKAKPSPTEFPPTMVIKSFENVPELDPAENETATSAEVHDAIHRISGALLKPGKKTKPIENVLTDVLKAISGERNATSTTRQPTGSTPSPPPPTPPKRSSPSAASNLTKEPRPPSAEPEIGPTVVGSKGHLRLPGSQSDEESSVERETEEDVSLIESTTAKPKRKPTKSPIHYFTKPSKKNVSTTPKRPTDFYDDEIFGYDPYQTFLHGVYVAQTENNEGVGPSPANDVPHHYHVANMKQRPPFVHPHNRPPGIKNQSGGSSKRKPVPSLPDHLHRPRPSHLEYQHAAADTIDTETGLTTVKVQHPADKFGNHKQNLEADKLSSIPRPLLAAHVVPVHKTTPAPEKVLPTSAVRTPPTFPTTHATKTSQRPLILTHSPPANQHVHHGHPSGSHGVKENPQGVQADHSRHGERRPLFPKAPVGNPGLEGTITQLDKEMKSFVDICNRLALRFFSGVTNPMSQATSAKNVVLSPFTVISSLGLLFLGARGSTAAQLDSLLSLDDQMTFNPHLMYHNVTQSFLSQSNTAAAVIRLLIADKNKGDVLDFFKMRVQHFYDARVEEADYKYAGHLAQSIINQMIRAQIQRQSYEMLNGSLPLTGPLTLLTATFFDGQFGGIRDLSTESMDFIHLADLGRQLIPLPAVGLRGPFRAAYEETLDATAVEIPYNTRDLSLILILPGRAGEYPIGGLDSLKTRLTLESWTFLMRSFMAREPFKVILPQFRHHSALNLTQITQRFGLTDMFRPHLAKFKGINGLNDLHLDPNLMHYAELSTFEQLSDTLSEGAHKKLDLMKILRPHVRGEPLSINDWAFSSRHPPNSPFPRTNQKPSLPPLSYTRIRSGRTGAVAEPLSPEEKVIRFERPFLYVLRHNPTGFILMMGQYLQPNLNQSPTDNS